MELVKIVLLDVEVSLGGVMENDLVFFSKFIGRGVVYRVEVWGLYEGMQLAKRKNFEKVEIQVDSFKVVSDVEERKRNMHHSRNLVAKICNMWELN